MRVGGALTVGLERGACQSLDDSVSGLESPRISTSWGWLAALDILQQVIRLSMKDQAV